MAKKTPDPIGCKPRLRDVSSKNTAITIVFLDGKSQTAQFE